MSTGSSVTAASIETATTMIAPIAIERIVVESTRNSPASEIITVIAGERDRQARGPQRDPPGLVRRARPR